MKQLLIAAAVVSVLAPSASPADGDHEKDWNRVRELPPGARVEVIHSGLKRSQGELLRATDSEIAISSDVGSTIINRTDVRRDLLAGAGAVIGCASGAALGAALTGPVTIYRSALTGATP